MGTLGVVQLYAAVAAQPLQMWWISLCDFAAAQQKDFHFNQWMGAGRGGPRFQVATLHQHTD